MPAALEILVRLAELTALSPAASAATPKNSLAPKQIALSPAGRDGEGLFLLISFLL